MDASVCLSEHLDETLDVPTPWRYTRGALGLFVAFMVALWPDVEAAAIRAVIALLSIGAVSWVFNLAFWWVWRKRYDRVKLSQKLLHEAAVTIKTHPGVHSHDDGPALAWIGLKLREFLNLAFKHQIRADFDQFNRQLHIKAEEYDLDEPLARKQAAYLRKLGDTLKYSDLDEHFLLPSTFRQYHEAKQWPQPPKGA